jgi:prepilin signal peptidase PulO-like enzyme (type II secretory pathway)
MIALLGGLALAFVLERAVLAWTGQPVSGPASHLSLPRLAWQGAEWRGLLTRVFAAAVPGVLLVAVAHFEGVEAVRVSMLGIALLACCATDLLAYRVPDALTLPGLVVALAFSALAGQPPLLAAAGAAGLAAVVLSGAAVLTRGGLGGGDVKLGALVGASLGLPGGAAALGAGILVGGFVVIALTASGQVRRDQGVPFGPFLALPAVGWLLVG